MSDHSVVDAGPGWDFFVSYTSQDRGWAEWIAWQLEASKYTVLLQAWDMIAGSQWSEAMHKGMQRSSRTVAILSESYLGSAYGQAEWRAAYERDPSGFMRKLIPIRIEDCPRPGILGQIVSVDLFGLPQEEARLQLLQSIESVRSGRAKPNSEPSFPGSSDSQATGRPRSRRRAIRRAENPQGWIEQQESHAKIVRSIEVLWVPGLLQIAEYTRMLAISNLKASHDVSESATARAIIAGRMPRQEILDDTSKQFKFILFKNVLENTPVTAGYMLAQIDRIESLAQAPNIDIRIISDDSLRPGFPLGHGYEIIDDDLVLIDLQYSVVDIRGAECKPYIRLFDYYLENSDQNLGATLRELRNRYARLMLGKAENSP